MTSAQNKSLTTGKRVLQTQKNMHTRTVISDFKSPSLPRRMMPANNELLPVVAGCYFYSKATVGFLAWLQVGA